METHEITDGNFELKKAIAEGEIRPTGVLDVTVWANRTKLDIRLNKAFEDNSIPDELLLFFWDYAGAKPYVIREIEMRKGCISLEADRSLLFQMQLLHLDSLRVGIAFRLKESYFCGYFRNVEVKRKELTLADRSICKMASMNKFAFVAYWTEGGILSVMFREEKKFDEDFYKVKLCGYHWENEKLVVYLEAPLAVGDARLSLYSVSTNRICYHAAITLERSGDMGLKTVWKAIVDLSGMSAEDSDGYRLLCALDGHLFQVFWDSEKDEDNLCKITLQSGGVIDACAVRDINGRFILKTGKVYPVMLSIVTAVYNTAPFLAEMINSVLSQKVDKLEEYCRDYKNDYYQNIYELILVDDGSTDESGEILNDYAGISDKIKVIHKENGGVSSARNTGIKISKGKYINFADSDDKLSENFIEECLLFFEEHADEVDIVTTPLHFFDGRNEEHWGNGKFKSGSRIINLQEHYKNVLMFVNASVFKNPMVKGVRAFNEKLKTAEDMNFIYSFFIEDRPYLGLVSTCSYLYRRRTTGEESLIQQSKKDKNRYLEYFTVGTKYLVSESREKYGEVPRFVQYLIACDLQWRFIEDGDAKIARSVLNDEEFLTYKKYLHEILSLIDLDLIWAQEKIWREQKMFMLRLKYGIEPEKRYVKSAENVYYYYEEQRLVDAASNYLMIDFMGIKSSSFYIEGTNHTFEKDAEVYICMNGEFFPMLCREDADFDIYAVGEKAFYGKHFYFEAEIDNEVEGYEIKLYEKFNGYYVRKTNIRYGFHLPLSKTYSDSYYIENGWCIRREGSIRLRPVRVTPEVFHNPYCMHSFLRYERDFVEEIKRTSKLEKQKLQDALEFRENALQTIANYRRFSEKKIWLISDRVNVAGDNGEALFIYINQLRPQNIETYFVINEDCADYERLKEYGNVVGQGTIEHIVLHFLAEYVISSQMDQYIQNPLYWKNGNDIFKDLVCRPKFVFLQHGIIKDDLSRWINRLNKNLFGFVTSTRAEYASILEYPYLYSEREIWLTGLPRYDRLYHNEKRYITIMPTWRSYLSYHDEIDQNRIVMKSGFKETEYFMFYNNLINNGRLLENAEKLGYQICFRPHPAVMKNLSDFSHDSRVIFFEEDIPYRDIYAESNLCVTDYSSSVMDFAYLRKPVVYIQFDKEKFFSGAHNYDKGYFDYDEDGFGEVVYDIESLVDTIIDYMKNNCQLKPRYLDRINRFFTFNDKNNCERVYGKLLDNRER